MGSIVRNDNDREVVLWSSRALASIANKGDKCALEALKQRFNWGNSNVRSEVVESFGKVAIPGDDWATSEITKLLSDSDAKVRKHTVPVYSYLVASKEQQT